MFQLDKAYLNKFGGDKFIAESAGLEPGIFNPLVVGVMKEEVIDISRKFDEERFLFCKTRGVFSRSLRIY